MQLILKVIWTNNHLRISVKSLKKMSEGGRGTWPTRYEISCDVSMTKCPRAGSWSRRRVAEKKEALGLHDKRGISPHQGKNK